MTAMRNLRRYMFENVYRNSACKREDEKVFYIISDCMITICSMWSIAGILSQKILIREPYGNGCMRLHSRYAGHYAIEKFREHYEQQILAVGAFTRWEFIYNKKSKKQYRSYVFLCRWPDSNRHDCHRLILSFGDNPEPATL